MSKLFKLDIVTPIKTFSFENVSYVKCPGVDGYFGIMKNHTNSIINLTDGTISVKTDKANGTKCEVCWKISPDPCERHSS